MNKNWVKTAPVALLMLLSTFVSAEVLITKDMKSVAITLNDESFVVERNQNKDHKINELYASTTRGKIQPIQLAPGLETIGELEFIHYMEKAQHDKHIAIIDTRTAGWYARLRIPGAINIPNTDFDERDTAIETAEDNFSVKENKDGSLDFSNAKTVVAYCNGFWCGQTPALLKNAQFSLLALGYPVEKLKYYRGGMQAWTALGLTVVGDEAK